MELPTLDRLKYAQWILERNLQWIAAADVKTAVIVTISTAMLGYLAAEFRVAQQPSCYVIFCSAVAAGLLGFAMFCAAMTVFPRIKGPPNSFIFAGPIAEMTDSQYGQQLQAATPQQLLDDCIRQIHVNARIASQKFAWVRAGIASGLFGVPVWLAALATLHS